MPGSGTASSSSTAKSSTNGPFIWHIWEWTKGWIFGPLVNYHETRPSKSGQAHLHLPRRLDPHTAVRRRFRYSWSQRSVGSGPGLQKKLEAIRDGENPYDIHVRWKPPHEQPIGWDPDLNDGVRLNVRPFVTAGVLRPKVKVKWNIDRGRDPDGSERINDLHVGLAGRQAAREAQKA